MSLTFNPAITSLSAQKNLVRSTRLISTSIERLSSGLRIISASDDPGGLALSSRLKSDALVYKQGVKNINDGISFYSVAESATSELSGVVSQLNELATQSTNENYSTTQRSTLDTQFQALQTEYNRIISTTSFNGTRIFSNSTSLSIQVGDSQIATSVSTTADFATLSGLSITSAPLAVTASTALSAKVSTISGVAGQISANLSRFSVALENTQAQASNYDEAYHKIVDVDEAAELASLTRNQIVQQSSIALLAQANQSAGLVLKLLGAEASKE